MEATYQTGVPCWVDTLQPDLQGALDFYGHLLGWDFVGPGPMPGGGGGRYFVARFRGREVAGIGSQPPGGPATPTWDTYIQVASADATAEKVKSAGGKIVMAPFDVLPAGRTAVLADPMGATFRAWEARERKGAQLVDEPGTWSMSALNTDDLQSAERFYGKLFGWKTTAAGKVMLWRLEGYVGGLPEQQMPRDVVAMMVPFTDDQAGKGTPSRWRVTFWVHDADSTADEAVRRHGTIITPAFDLPGFAGFRQAVLADPAGAVFTVVAKRYRSYG